MTQAQAPLTKKSTETRRFDIDCSLRLAAGVALSGVGQITVEPQSDPALTVIATEINSAPKTLQNPITAAAYTVPAGQCLSIDVQGGAGFKSKLARAYELSITCPTSDGQVRTFVVPISVS